MWGSPESPRLFTMRPCSRFTALLLGLLMTLRIASPAGAKCESHPPEHCAAGASHAAHSTVCHVEVPSQPADHSGAGLGDGCCQMMASCSASFFSATTAVPASTLRVAAITPENPAATLHSLAVAPESPPPRA